MDLSVWKTLGNAAWKTAEPKEMVFLAFVWRFQRFPASRLTLNLNSGM